MINVIDILMNGFGLSQEGREEYHVRCVCVNAEVLPLPKIHHLLTLTSFQVHKACLLLRKTKDDILQNVQGLSGTGTGKLRKPMPDFMSLMTMSNFCFIFFMSDLTQSITISA